MVRGTTVRLARGRPTWGREKRDRVAVGTIGTVVSEGTGQFGRWSLVRAADGRTFLTTDRNLEATGAPPARVEREPVQRGPRGSRPAWMANSPGTCGLCGRAYDVGARVFYAVAFMGADGAPARALTPDEDRERARLQARALAQYDRLGRAERTAERRASMLQVSFVWSRVSHPGCASAAGLPGPTGDTEASPGTRETGTEMGTGEGIRAIVPVVVPQAEPASETGFGGDCGGSRLCGGSCARCMREDGSTSMTSAIATGGTVSAPIPTPGAAPAVTGYGQPEVYGTCPGYGDRAGTCGAYCDTVQGRVTLCVTCARAERTDRARERAMAAQRGPENTAGLPREDASVLRFRGVLESLDAEPVAPVPDTGGEGMLARFRSLDLD